MMSVVNAHELCPSGMYLMAGSWETLRDQYRLPSYNFIFILYSPSLICIPLFLPFFLVLYFIPFPVFLCITTSYSFLSITRSSRCTAYAKGWPTEKHRFHFRQGKICCVFSKRSVHTVPVIHSASCSLCTVDSYLRDAENGP
jgi:hypothetical protein